MKEIIIEIIAWMLGISIIVVEIVLGLSLIFTILAPSAQEVQCTSIEGAKWSREGCYKNGIRINFNAE